MPIIGLRMRLEQSKRGIHSMSIRSKFRGSHVFKNIRFQFWVLYSDSVILRQNLPLIKYLIFRPVIVCNISSAWFSSMAVCSASLRDTRWGWASALRWHLLINLSHGRNGDWSCYFALYFSSWFPWLKVSNSEYNTRWAPASPFEIVDHFVCSREARCGKKAAFTWADSIAPCIPSLHSAGNCLPRLRRMWPSPP